MMRRRDREILNESEIKAIIKESKVCRLGMVSGNRPYVVPLCFGYYNNTLYFHSASKGQKIEVLRHDPNVCFEFDLIAEVKESEDPCSWGMIYKSVIGFGKVAFIDGSDEKRKALNIIMAQYSAQQFPFSENKVEATAVFKVEIESMTGKQSGF